MIETKNNTLQIFKNEEFGSVRTITIENEPYFVGKDVAEILGYRNGSRDINRHVDIDDRKKSMVFDGNQNKETIVINESGLYSLILSSKLPKAKEFKHWVTAEVLPSIRKHGAYLTKEALEHAMTDPKFTIGLLQALDEERQARVAATKIIEQQKPLVDFANHVGDTKDLITVGQLAKLAKDEHIKIGRNRLFEWLRQHKYINNRNEPYQQYVECGYFKVKEIIKDVPHVKSIFPTTFVTGKGQLHIIKQLRKEFKADLEIAVAE